MMELSARLVRNRDIVFRTIKEEGVIYDPHTKRLHMLNKTALLAWNLWDGEHSLADIVDEILSEYEADPEVVTGDIISCANELRRYGLLDDAA